MYRLIAGITYITCLALSFSVHGQDSTSLVWFEGLYLNKVSLQSPDEKLRLLEGALQSAHEEHDPRAETSALIELAIFHQIQFKNYDKSLGYLIQAIPLTNSSELTQERILTYIAISKIFEEAGLIDKSLYYIEQANTIKTNDLLLLIRVLNARGHIFTRLEKYSEAEKDFQEAIRHAQNGELRAKEADALFLIAELNLHAKEYDQSLIKHKEALAFRREIGDREKEATSLNSVGLLYILMKNFERAEMNLSLALNIRKKLTNKEAVADSYNNIARLQIAKGDFRGAIKNLHLALAEIQKIDNSDLLLAIHENLTLCYKELGDYKNALLHKEEYAGKYEMLENEKNRASLVVTESKVDIEKRDSEIRLLETDMRIKQEKIESQEQQNRMLILIIILGAIIIILVFYLYSVIRKTNKRLKEINETKDKLFSIIGHDLKGPLNSLTAFSSLLIHHAGNLSQEEIKMLSGDVDKSLKNLFSLLENLLEWGRSQTGNIDFTPASFDLVEVIKENLELLNPLAQKKKIALVNMSADKIPVNAHRNSINTVIRNLISNAIKFTPDGGQITISTEPVGKHFKIIISDNGVGINKDTLKRLFKVGTKQSTLGTAQEKGTGLGLIICKDFVEKNGGTIGVDSELGKGTRFHFTILKN